MKKLLSFLSTLLLGSSAALAQYTTVSATVVDSDTTTWAKAPYSWSFQPGPNQSNPANYTYNGAPLSAVHMSGSGAANGSGVLSFAPYDVTLIRPVGASYNVRVCPNASSKCSTVNFRPSGGSLSLSAQINAAILAPRFSATSGNYGYNDAETTPTLHPGSTYWNVTSSKGRCYSGSAWADCGGGSGSGTVSGQANGVIPLATAATTIGAQSHLSDNGTTVSSSEPFTAPSLAGTGSNPFINLPSNTTHTFAAGDLAYKTGSFYGGIGTGVSTALEALPTFSNPTSGPVTDPGGWNLYQYNNSSGALTFNMPTGVAGLQRHYRNDTGKTGAITLQLGGSDVADLNGTATTAGGALASAGAAGDDIDLISDRANHWYSNVVKGTWSIPTPASWAVTNAQLGAGTGSFLTSKALPAFSSTLTNPSVIIVDVSAVDSTPTFSVTDSCGSNTYVDCGPGVSKFQTNVNSTQCFIAKNTCTTASLVVTVHDTNSVQYLAGSAIEVTGANATTPVDGTAYSKVQNQTGGAAGSDNLSGGAITSVSNGDFIYAQFNANNAYPTAGTSPNAFTMVGTPAWQEYFVQTSAAAITATASDSTSSDPYTAIVVALKH